MAFRQLNNTGGTLGGWGQYRASSEEGTCKSVLDPSAWKARAAALFGTLALIWAVSLYGLYVDERLVFALALVPRRVDGLPGILSAPLVHGSFAHLLANTFPLLILGGMVVIRGGAYYLTTTFPIVVLGGLGLWLLGRDAAHIGASGLLFGYCGFLVARGYYERRLGSIAVSIVVVVAYGGHDRRRSAARRPGLLGGSPVWADCRRAVRPRSARQGAVTKIETLAACGKVLSSSVGAWQTWSMKRDTPSYHGYRFPPEIISHAVWLYHRFGVNFREVEDLLAQRGVTASYETIRHWCQMFGLDYARQLRRRRGRLGDTWSLD